jgi:hypothetical protein
MQNNKEHIQKIYVFKTEAYLFRYVVYDTNFYSYNK